MDEAKNTLPLPSKLPDLMGSSPNKTQEMTYTS
jgi:hypothetical protein